MYKIHIIEDDLGIAEGLSEHFGRWGYEVFYTTDFEKVLVDFLREQPSLVIMDIHLPFFSGFHWCSEIRKISQVPLIFLSSADDQMSIVMAMNMGGDEFIEKPFDLNVMTAKVQALLRRTYDFSERLNILSHLEAVLNLSEASLTYRGTKVELTKNEFKILESLMERPGEILTREEIINRLWESEAFIDDNTLTVNVTRLRKKLAEVGLENFVVTKKGIGYLVGGMDV
ncbi:response regulator transcription factor [Ohessyouella blattaphilus]|uniref:Stage 0 sporulation protein A homolog n=1 Tax=Ohessyouella blattaphilus TaxID=2949333 RepID=A0ABT1EGQ4_9FIRM|nr:response regulator transcription factor [Ohessyouella blattaphilus]MCP1109886.1 response regulator transcription factor [Ohessyouella blattaphilus]MCR8563280.1 response regulator transcription factor [Ohessyouella blattaphilus]